MSTAKSIISFFFEHNLPKPRRKLEKTTELSKKLIFGQSYMKFAVAMGTFKMTDTIDKSKLPRKMNEHIAPF